MATCCAPGYGGGWPRWDGACVYIGQPGANRHVTPDDVRAIRTLVAGRAGGFDIRISGADRALLPDFAAAGATWYTRWIPPGDPAATRRIIADGPPPPTMAP